MSFIKASCFSNESFVLSSGRSGKYTCISAVSVHSSTKLPNESSDSWRLERAGAYR